MWRERERERERERGDLAHSSVLEEVMKITGRVKPQRTVSITLVTEFHSGLFRYV